jgi:hypothetical protein
MRNGMAVPALPFPAVGTDLIGRRMAGRQTSSASSVLKRRRGTAGLNWEKYRVLSEEMQTQLNSA